MRNPSFPENNSGTTEKFFPNFFIQEKKFFQNSTGCPRYTFNGKEKDDEDGLQDYGMRMYDGRLGRFLSVDPLAKKYAMLSPYSFAENDVIRAVDIDGLEKYIVDNIVDHGTITQINVVWNVQPDQNGNMTMIENNGIPGWADGSVYRTYHDKDGNVAPAPANASSDNSKLSTLELFVAQNGTKTDQVGKGFSGGTDYSDNANVIEKKSQGVIKDNGYIVGSTKGAANPIAMAKRSFDQELKETSDPAKVFEVKVIFSSADDQTKYGNTVADQIKAKCPNAVVTTTVDVKELNVYKSYRSDPVRVAVEMKSVNPPAPKTGKL